jgi:hypothetical protein
LKSVIFEEGSQLESIGRSAFFGAGLTSITVPNSVTYIGIGAFAFCISLESMTLPFIGISRTATGNNAKFGIIFTTGMHEGGTATYQGGVTYYIPSTLRTVVITDTTSIGDSAFRNCNTLTSLTIPEGLTSIGSNAFPEGLTVVFASYFEFQGSTLTKYFNSSRTSYTIPDFITRIGAGAFRNSNLQSIMFPASVTHIDSSAFEDSKSLRTVQFSHRSQLHTIGYRAFAGCENLFYFDVNAVQVIGAYAFENCRALGGISFTGVGLHTIGDHAFKGCVNFYSGSSVMPLSGFTRIGNGAFIDTPVTRVHLTTQNAPHIGVNAFPPNAEIEWRDNFVFHGTTLTRFIGNQQDYTVPNFIKTIGEDAFTGNGRIRNVILSEGVTQINSHAFRDSGLGSIVIPSSVTTIQEMAFKGSRALHTVHFNNFMNSQLQTIENWAFQNCGSLTNFSMPSSVNHIGQSAFEHTRLSNLELNANYIGYNAFAFTGNLKSVVFSDRVRNIGFGAFQYSGLTSVTIPATVENIGGRAFARCRDLKTASIGIRNVSDYMFYGSGLETVTFTGNRTERIGRAAFKNNPNLTGVVLPVSTRWIDHEAFQNTGLTEFIIPYNVTFVGERAFYGCTRLENIIISLSVTHLGYSALGGCTALTIIYAEALRQPDDWHSRWNPLGRQVWWGWRGMLTSFTEGTTIIAGHRLHGLRRLANDNAPAGGRRSFQIELDNDRFQIVFNRGSVEGGQQRWEMYLWFRYQEDRTAFNNGQERRQFYNREGWRMPGDNSIPGFQTIYTFPFTATVTRIVHRDDADNGNPGCMGSEINSFHIL